jgi:hypothetical protein
VNQRLTVQELKQAKNILLNSKSSCSATFFFPQLPPFLNLAGVYCHITTSNLNLKACFTQGIGFKAMHVYAWGVLLVLHLMYVTNLQVRHYTYTVTLVTHTITLVA